jgi:hypothetical protein
MPITALLWACCHIMDLMNPAIQYDRRSTEKPFLLNCHSLWGWDPSFNADRDKYGTNADRINMALQQISSSEVRALI